MRVLYINLSSNPKITVICGRISRSFRNGGITPSSRIQISLLIKDGKIAATVDWESAGWYPEYWEYSRWAVSNYNSSRIWRDLRDDGLDPYPDELRVDEYLGTVFTRL